MRATLSQRLHFAAQTLLVVSLSWKWRSLCLARKSSSSSSRQPFEADLDLYGLSRVPEITSTGAAAAAALLTRDFFLGFIDSTLFFCQTAAPTRIPPSLVSLLSPDYNATLTLPLEITGTRPGSSESAGTQGGSRFPHSPTPASSYSQDYTTLALTMAIAARDQVTAGTASRDESDSARPGWVAEVEQPPLNPVGQAASSSTSLRVLEKSDDPARDAFLDELFSSIKVNHGLLGDLETLAGLSGIVNDPGRRDDLCNNVAMDDSPDIDQAIMDVAEDLGDNAGAVRKAWADLSERCCKLAEKKAETETQKGKEMQAAK